MPGKGFGSIADYRTRIRKNITTRYVDDLVLSAKKEDKLKYISNKLVQTGMGINFNK